MNISTSPASGRSAASSSSAQQNFPVQELVSRLKASDPELGMVISFLEQKGITFHNNGSPSSHVDNPSLGSSYSQDKTAQEAAKSAQQTNAAAASIAALPPKPAGPKG